MRYKVTQRYEETWIYEIEADDQDSAIRAALREEGQRQRLPRSQTVTVEAVEND